MKYLSVIFLLLSCITAFTQNKQKETRLNCIAFWKKGEEKTYLITRKKEKIPAGKATNSPDFLIESKMTVIDSSAAGYTISWVYGIPDGIEKNSLQYQMVAFLEGMKFVYKTDELGTFTELVNWEEIRDFYVRMLEMQFEGRKKDSTLQKIMDQTLALFKTREMVESTMIREIQLFHAPYGVSFSTKDTSVNTEINISITNSLMPAIQRWRIEEAGTGGDDFKLVMTQEMDSAGGAKVLESLIKKYSPSEKTNIEEIKKELSSFKLDDYSEYKFVRSTGWLNSYTVTRTAKTGEISQIETYKMELKE